MRLAGDPLKSKAEVKVEECVQPWINIGFGSTKIVGNGHSVVQRLLFPCSQHCLSQFDPDENDKQT